MANKINNEPQDILGNLDDEDLDAFKAFFVSFLMENTFLHRDDIYSYLFGEGKRIIWN
ncbi:MAG TPA: hypothetical protein VEE82_00925 [Thermodesulfovibrionales bacterium]|nr:hypothetical protein [Thermodesulfovibrionales bacterium]